MRQILLLHVGSVAHRPKLDHAEAPAAESRTVLKKEGRAGRIEANRECNERQDGGQQDDQNGTDNAVNDYLGDECSRLENRATELKERLVVMPYEGRPQPVNADCTRRKQYLAARVQTLLDQTVDPGCGKIGADDNCFGVVFFDQLGKIVDPTEKVIAGSAIGAHIACNPVIAAGGRDRSLEASAQRGISNEDRGSSTPCPRPDVAQEPLRELANKKQ